MNDVIQINVSSDKNFCYIFGETEYVLIDPANNSDLIDKALNEYKIIPKYIINTHTHYDHNNLNSYYQKKFNIPVIVHKSKSGSVNKPKIEVSGNEIFKIGNDSFKIIHTPGHTRDSITIVYKKYLFTGDTLFADEDCGRIFYPGGINDMYRSLNIFKLMDDDYIVYSGHKYGKYDHTTLKYEKENNPALLCATLEKLRIFKNC